MTMEIPHNNSSRPSGIIQPDLRHVAWEITRSCNLYCAHCRASAHQGGYEGELSTEECLRIIDEIVEVGHPMLVLTGGEPLLRPDVLQIAQYGADRGLRVVLGTNGTLVTAEMAARLKAIPIACVGISLDFPTAERHDSFRCMVGAFDVAVSGINNARQAGIDIQINSTITKMNVAYLDELVSLAQEVGAKSFHPFLLVPTGRGKDLESVELSPQEYEQTLNWLCAKTDELRGKLSIRPICAPHFMRIARQRQQQSSPGMSSVSHPAASGHPGAAFTRGCLAGTAFAFISHRGIVQGCGYLDIEAGDLRQASFSQIWRSSALFNDLRNLSHYRGKCGLCEYKMICGGCRARSYEVTGDYLEAEPSCVYQPVARQMI